MRAYGGAYPAKKRAWGTLKAPWVPQDTRDAVIDYVRHWAERTEIAVKLFVSWLGITQSKYYDWKSWYGKVNEHNAWIPGDWWLEEWEKKAIVSFHAKYPLEGYRRLAFMMIDADVVHFSPSSVYRVPAADGLLQRWNRMPSKKGMGFEQPIRPRDHWHVDISYINVSGTFYYLCSMLDGCSRTVIHWEIRTQMQETDVEIVLQRAREEYPEAKPRIISDNGPQFIARDFKEFMRICGMTHVRISPYYPQSNGKIERWHKSLKSECIRKKVPLSLDDARRVVEDYVYHYNNVRLHSAIGYVTPKDKLVGREKEVFAERDRKPKKAREDRKARRQAMKMSMVENTEPAVIAC